jgi:uncharacterized membrane protein YdbT with pleckstrin-like domain
MPNLLAGESMVLPPIKKHWVVVVKGTFWPTLLGIAAIVVMDGLLLGVPIGDAARVILTLVVLAVVAGAWYIVWLEWQAATLTVTDQRVILELGVVMRTTKVIPLDRVQDVSTKQTPMGQFLDYGSVEIDTAGAIANELFTYASHPEMLRDQVFVLSEQLRRGL